LASGGSRKVCGERKVLLPEIWNVAMIRRSFLRTGAPRPARETSDGLPFGTFKIEVPDDASFALGSRTTYARMVAILELAFCNRIAASAPPPVVVRAA